MNNTTWIYVRDNDLLGLSEAAVEHGVEDGAARGQDVLVGWNSTR